MTSKQLKQQQSNLPPTPTSMCHHFSAILFVQSVQLALSWGNCSTCTSPKAGIDWPWAPKKLTLHMVLLSFFNVSIQTICIFICSNMTPKPTLCKNYTSQRQKLAVVITTPASHRYIQPSNSLVQDLFRKCLKCRAPLKQKNISSLSKKVGASEKNLGVTAKLVPKPHHKWPPHKQLSKPLASPNMNQTSQSSQNTSHSFMQSQKVMQLLSKQPMYRLGGGQHSSWGQLQLKCSHSNHQQKKLWFWLLQPKHKP